jgi:hypothetical protein
MDKDYIILDRRPDPFATPRLVACLTVFSALLSSLVAVLF